jgi:hypothetical protein
LLRCLANSSAYQRTSRSADEASSKRIILLGQRPVKLMSADMLFESLKLATGDPKLDLLTVDPKESSRFGESTPIGDAYQEFSRLFETNEDDATDFTHGIPQLLALINHPRLSAGGPTVDALIKADTDPQRAIETMYLGTISRRPTAEEAAEAAEFVASAKDRRAGYDGLLWMLMNRSEFLLVR